MSVPVATMATLGLGLVGMDGMTYNPAASGELAHLYYRTHLDSFV